MAANPVRLMTVEEFSVLPESVGEYNYELHHGELVPVPRPKFKHYVLQSWLRDLLRRLAPPGSFVDIEMAFQAVPEYDLRVADVAFLKAERFAKVDHESYIQGAPDLIIEILSPSNTAREMYEKEQLCLANGCREFWVFDPDKHYVRVAHANGPTITYRPGESILLKLFGDVALSVDDMFRQ